jgi:hypothetical protein
MNDFDTLLSQFHSTNEETPSTNWGEQQHTLPNPEDEDGERLEQSIRNVFSNKQLLNKALFTFLGVFTANTLTKIQYDGRLHFGKDFMVATVQTASVGAALWVAFDEYRAVSNASKTGKTRFYSEVRQYEVKPSPQTETPWLSIGLAALGVLLLAAMTRGRSQ